MACIFAIMAAMFSSGSIANDGPQPGGQYKIIGKVYLNGVYENLNDRRVSKETARVYVSSVRVGKRAWMAFECLIPRGTIITFIGPAPKIWGLPFGASRYFVRLDPDFSRGLDVVIALKTGLDGDIDGLNSQLFARAEDRFVIDESVQQSETMCEKGQ